MLNPHCLLCLVVTVVVVVVYFCCLVLLLFETMVSPTNVSLPLARFDESAAGAITGHQDRLEGLRGREGTG